MTGHRVNELRAWARGSYGLEAAVELVIRFNHGYWLEQGICNDDDHPWIEWEYIAEALDCGVFANRSHGEIVILQIAASIADSPVAGLNLGDACSILDNHAFQLVIKALRHAHGDRTVWEEP